MSKKNLYMVEVKSQNIIDKGKEERGEKSFYTFFEGSESEIKNIPTLVQKLYPSLVGEKARVSISKISRNTYKRFQRTGKLEITKQLMVETIGGEDAAHETN